MTIPVSTVEFVVNVEVSELTGPVLYLAGKNADQLKDDKLDQNKSAGYRAAHFVEDVGARSLALDEPNSEKGYYCNKRSTRLEGYLTIRLLALQIPHIDRWSRSGNGPISEQKSYN